MKKKISIIAIIIALVLISLTVVSYATEVQPRTGTTDDVVLIPDGEAVTTNEEITEEEQYDIIYDDVYLVEDMDYEMNQLIDGNLFLMVNGDLKFTGAVKGSAYLLVNGSVEFTSEAYIADSLYILATEKTTINGEMYDIYSLSDGFEIAETAYINRDVRAMANDVKLRGIIYRNIYLNAGTIDVKDETSELLIGGNFDYTSTQEFEQIKEVVKYGEVKFSLQEETDETVVIEETMAEKISKYAWGALSSAVYVLVVYGILKFIAPKFVGKIGKDLKEKGIVAFAIGLLGWFILVISIIITIILLFTSLGAPVAIITWILMFVGIYISPAVFSIALLKVLKKENENIGAEIAILIVIAVAIWLLQQVPVVGGIVSLAVVTTGLGLVIRNAIVRKEEKNEKVETVIEEKIEVVPEVESTTDTTEKTDTEESSEEENKTQE